MINNINQVGTKSSKQNYKIVIPGIWYIRSYKRQFETNIWFVA